MPAGFARLERQALCDLFLSVGPDAPTLDAGWRTADLAAHLVLRERRPDAALGIVVPLLAGRTERVQRQLRDARPWPDLVRTVRQGPPAPLRPLDEVMNTVEFFIHHEDVRRAAPEASPRALDPTFERVLWRRLATMSRLMARRWPVGVVLESAGFGRHVAKRGTPEVTVTGAPGELLLWVTGRREAARVELAGPQEALSALDQASFGL